MYGVALTLALLSSQNFGFGDAVQINYVKVPQAVKNNSGQAIVLDCNYSVRPDDTELVVKWFLNGELVYQWLPPQKPQSLGPLKSKVDLEFKASGDPKTAHRALKIVNPTSDIAGEYKCYVSTFADEDFSTKTMTIFEPESSLVLFKSAVDNARANFTCAATDVYPQPKLVLYTDKQTDDANKKLLDAMEWTTKRNNDGRYSIVLTATISLANLDFGSLIFCELRIPGTGYIKRKSLLYYPQEIENWNGAHHEVPSLIITLGISSVLF